MRKLIIVVACSAHLATNPGLLAQNTAIRLVPPPSVVKCAQSSSPAGLSAETTIATTVIDESHVPVAHVKVQLRSLVTGDVQQQGESNENGEYKFAADPGTYVVEMVSVDDSIIAVSNAASLACYETLRALVRLPGRWDSRLRRMVVPISPASFLGMSAQHTITAATVRLAADTNIPPVSSGEPVSPTSPK